MSSVHAIPMLPCGDIDEIAEFAAVLGLRVTYRQQRPYTYLALEGHGLDLHYYGLPEHDPAASHSTCGFVLDDPAALWAVFADAFRAHYGKVPVAGLPRMTRPRPRKNVGGSTGFSLLDPAGNWIRFFASTENADAVSATSPLGESLLNAIVLADSKGDEAQAAKILRGALDRAQEDDPAREEAAAFLAELDERLH